MPVRGFFLLSSSRLSFLFQQSLLLQKQKHQRHVTAAITASSVGLFQSTTSNNIQHDTTATGNTMAPQQREDQTTSPAARLVTIEALEACGERLRAGDLVAFPTETVYGLGCHALDPSAVQKVFDAKERPLTDPLIVHVATAEDALPLWDEEYHTQQTSILKAIGKQFWPGPLTLVAKAASHVPPILMANTGFVACRCPLHPVAQALIQQAKVPIAAPSANKFGHVSPTQSEHVMDDLGQEDVWVVQDTESCHVGVESTVAKLEYQELQQKYSLTILRQGAISVQDLQGCLDETGWKGAITVTSLSHKTSKDTEATVAPGQTVKHYSPRIPSFLMAPSLYQQSTLSQELTTLLENAIVLDYGGRLLEWKSKARQYRDLSPEGNSKEAAQRVFDYLRWTETADAAAQYVVFPQVVTSLPVNKSNHDEHDDDALTLALHDRLTRAASGVLLDSTESIRQAIMDVTDTR